MTRTVLRSVLRSVMVAGAATLLLAGCGTPEAGAAATVGSRRITVSDVQSATADIQAVYGADQPVSQRAVLYLLAAAPYIQELSTRQNAGTSADEVKVAFQGKVAHPSAAAVTVLQANASLGKLDQAGQSSGNDVVTGVLQQVTKELARDHFTVNPRYGTFDAEKGTVLAEQPNWLPVVATPSPSPAASQ